MKVHKPGTDCQVEFTILANGKKCAEYVLPDATADDAASTSVCFIPFPEEAILTMQGTFSGSVLDARMDVLADGAYVGTRVIDNPQKNEGILKQFDNRKVEVRSFLHVPDLEDRKTKLHRPWVKEGNLVTKSMSPGQQVDGGDDASGIGVGSITMIVSLNQQAFDTYEPPYSNYTIGKWRDAVDDVADSGIRPQHELMMDVFTDSDPVTDKKAGLYYREMRNVRPGNDPWAYLIFYYRTQAAIDAAGCVPLTESKALVPDAGLFIRASEQVMAEPRVRVHDAPPGPSNPPRLLRSLTKKQGTETSSSTSPVPTAAPARAPTISPGSETRKSMGLGQRFLFGNTLELEPDMQEPPNFIFDDDEQMPNVQSTGTGGGLQDTNVNANFEQQPPSEPPAQASQPDANTQPPQNPKPHVTFAEPLFSSNAKKPRLGGTMDTVSRMNFSSESDLMDDLASPSLTTYSRRSGTPKSGLSATRPSAAQSTSKPPSPAFQMPASQSTRKSSSPATQTPALKPAIKPSSPATQAKLDKRNATQFADDSSPTSTHSNPMSPPPPKRTRLEQMLADKAKLQAELQAKRERKAATQKKIEDDKRLREQQRQLWAEAETKRREEEEERIRVAEEEQAQALEAELEAMRAEAEREDEDLARVEEDQERQRRDWEELVRAREQSEIDESW